MKNINKETKEFLRKHIIKIDNIRKKINKLDEEVEKARLELQRSLS